MSIIPFDLIDFYTQSFETSQNKNVMKKNYILDVDLLNDYIQYSVHSSIDDLIEIVDNDNAVELQAKDIFQFSSFSDATYIICQKIFQSGNNGLRAENVGKLLLDDGKERNKIAYTKYGENHAKFAEILGLLQSFDHYFYLTAIGEMVLHIEEETRNLLLVRSAIRTKLVRSVLKDAKVGVVNLRQKLWFLADATYKRRASNIKALFKFLKEHSDSGELQKRLKNVQIE